MIMTASIVSYVVWSMITVDKLIYFSLPKLFLEKIFLISDRISCIFSQLKHKIRYVLEKNEVFFKLFLTNEMIWIS
jgi:hypothetical protein